MEEQSQQGLSEHDVNHGRHAHERHGQNNPSDIEPGVPDINQVQREAHRNRQSKKQGRHRDEK